MTTEEKANAYDKALEKTKSMIDDLRKGEDILAVSDLESMFPELKESEDERIRKAIVEFFKLQDDNTTYSFIPKKSILAWLEKQKEQPQEELVYRLNGLMQEYVKEGKDDAEKEHRFKCYRLFWDALEDADFFEQKEQKPPITESKRLANEVIEYLIRCGYSPVLKDDSKKEHFHIDIPRHEDDFWLSEEYKHCCGVLGEYYMEGDYGGDTYTLYIWRAKKEQKLNPSNSVGLEQKPANEPKFKVGDWIIFAENHNSVYQVERIDKYRYYLRHYLGGTLSAHFDNELIRQWTIQDAKPGDVLVCIGKYGQEVGIVKEYIGKYGGCDKCFETYCFVDWEGIFRAGEYMGSKEIHPATKEQRNTLMKAMADNGYTFDFENKKLNKKEQKPAEWSEEDKEHLKSIINTIERVQNDEDESAASILGYYESDIAWLKSLPPQPKVEWSEEDEEMFDEALTGILLAKNRMNDTGCIGLAERFEKAYKWLESFRPRPHWKPSEEQMTTLLRAEGVVRVHDTKELAAAIAQLYEQLKKLM